MDISWPSTFPYFLALWRNGGKKENIYESRYCFAESKVKPYEYIWDYWSEHCRSEETVFETNSYALRGREIDRDAPIRLLIEPLSLAQCARVGNT